MKNKTKSTAAKKIAEAIKLSGQLPANSAWVDGLGLRDLVGVVDWIRSLRARGQLFHMDDHPATVVNRSGSTFTPREASAVRQLQLRALELCKEYRVDIHELVKAVEAAWPAPETPKAEPKTWEGNLPKTFRILIDVGSVPSIGRVKLIGDGPTLARQLIGFVYEIADNPAIVAFPGVRMLYSVAGGYVAVPSDLVVEWVPATTAELKRWLDSLFNQETKS